MRSAAEISIQDSGVGIEPNLLPHVFERFRQGDGSSHRAFGGLGLGLAIVRQLMELHGGTVRAESAGPGCDSTFTLRFPIAALTGSRDQIGRVDDTSSLRRLRVLVVEDDPDSRDLIVALLSGNGADRPIRPARHSLRRYLHPPRGTRRRPIRNRCAQAIHRRTRSRQEPHRPLDGGIDTE